MTIALTIALILVVATAGTLWWRLYRADQENQKLRDLLVWYAEHLEQIRPVFEQAFIIRSVPDHSNDMRKKGTSIVAVRKGIETVLNFETLKEMTWLMIEMESERRVAVQRMAKALDSLAVWEKEHPVPSSP